MASVWDLISNNSVGSLDKALFKGVPYQMPNVNVLQLMGEPQGISSTPVAASPKEPMQMPTPAPKRQAEPLKMTPVGPLQANNGDPVGIDLESATVVTPTYADLLRDLVDKRMGGLSESEQQLNDLRSRGTSIREADLTPLLALADSMTPGGRLAQSYQRPVSRQEQIAALQKALAGEQQNLTGTIGTLAGRDIEVARADRTFEANEAHRAAQMELERERMANALRIAQMKAAKGASGGRVSQYEKARQQAMGRLGADYYTKDRPALINNAVKAKDAADRLEAAMRSGKELYGGLKGKTPDFIRTVTNPEAVEIRQEVESAIIDTLRPTLGAQFTENENKMIRQLTINPNLPDEHNLRNIRRLEAFIQRKVEATDAMHAWMEENDGSLTGFPFHEFGMVQVGGAKESSGGSGGSGQDQEAIKWAKANPNDPRSAQILRANGL